MSQLDRKAYYIERAAASRALAHQAVSAEVAAIHMDLAARYDRLVTQLDAPLRQAVRASAD